MGYGDLDQYQSGYRQAVTVHVFSDMEFCRCNVLRIGITDLHFYPYRFTLTETGIVTATVQRANVSCDYAA